MFGGLAAYLCPTTKDATKNFPEPKTLSGYHGTVPRDCTQFARRRSP